MFLKKEPDSPKFKNRPHPYGRRNRKGQILNRLLMETTAFEKEKMFVGVFKVKNNYTLATSFLDQNAQRLRKDIAGLDGRILFFMININQK